MTTITQLQELTEDEQVLIDSALGCYSEVVQDHADSARESAKKCKGPQRDASERLAEAFDRTSARVEELRRKLQLV